MKNILLLIVFLISLSTYSQQSVSQIVEHKAYETRLSAKITTLKINVNGYPSKKITNLKKEYSNWQGKIISISADPQTNILSIEHNALWQLEEIYEMMDKYNIPKNKIISDK